MIFSSGGASDTLGIPQSPVRTGGRCNQWGWDRKVNQAASASAGILAAPATFNSPAVARGCTNCAQPKEPALMCTGEPLLPCDQLRGATRRNAGKPSSRGDGHFLNTNQNTK